MKPYVGNMMWQVLPMIESGDIVVDDCTENYTQGDNAICRSRAFALSSWQNSTSMPLLSALLARI
jgi:hypothetical protein